MKWNVSVTARITMEYEEIEADSREEAIEIAKDRADEDLCFMDAMFDDFSYCSAWPMEDI